MRLGATPRRLVIGAIEVFPVSDGQDQVPPEMILAGAPSEEIVSVISGHLDPSGQLPVALSGFLIRSGGRQVLVDAGFGELSEEEGVGGAFGASLATLGVAPESIDAVVISHGHADHIGGLVATEGGRLVPTYRRAVHYVRTDEWSYWTSATSLATMRESMAEPAKRCLPPLAAAGVVELIEAEPEVAPGVRIISAPGHTPGHAAVAIDSGGSSALILGDCVFHPVNVVAPSWTCIFDVDPDLAAETRQTLLERAATERALILANHLASPGRVERGPAALRFIEVEDRANAV